MRSIRNIGGIKLPDTEQGESVLYVLDGQQRITSIYASIKGVSIERQNGAKEDFSRIFVNLNVDQDADEDLVITNTEDLDSGTYISLYDLLNGGLSLASRFDSKYHKKIEDYARVLNGFLFSVITLTDAKIEVATEVFTRINVGGEPLSLFEIMCAKTYDAEKKFDLAEKFEQLQKDWNDCSYETISNSTLLQSIAVCLLKECKKKDILSISRERFIDNWDKVISAFNNAIDYFHSYYHIPVSNLLPYDGLLVPFTYYFYKHHDNPTGNQEKMLEDFFWRNVLTSRYSSSLETKLAQDIKRIDLILGNQIPQYDTGVDITIESLTSNGYFSVGRAYIKGLLCILAELGPISFNNGTSVRIDNSWLKQANSKNYHHFFPRGYLKKNYVEDFKANHIANITIVDDSLNKRRIRDRAPSDYMTEFKSVNPNIDINMKTHLINDLNIFGVWNNDYNKFFIERLKAFQGLLKNKLILQAIDKI